MSRVLSNEVKQALKDIYYNEWTGKGKEAFAMLERASAAGDGDATCLLARCLCGHQYVWVGQGFPEDDDRATELLHKSVEQGGKPFSIKSHTQHIAQEANAKQSESKP